MIVPTTILSLAALSAAESNSSRNRGLRKSSTPWTAIAVVSGTAITGVVIGGLIGWFAKGSGGSCPTGHDCTPATCLSTHWYKTKATAATPAAGQTPAAAAVPAVCEPCKGNTKVSNVLALSGEPATDATACDTCVDGAYPNAAGTCEMCPEDKPANVKSNVPVKTAGPFPSEEDSCTAATPAANGGR